MVNFKESANIYSRTLLNLTGMTPLHENKLKAMRTKYPSLLKLILLFFCTCFIRINIFTKIVTKKINHFSHKREHFGLEMKITYIGK